MIIRTASCSCRRLSATCEGEPVSVSLCHCRECQRRTGSAFGIAAFFDRSKFRTAGESRTYTRSADSGGSISFHFCPDCGSTLFWMPSRKPDRIAVAVGAFADPLFPGPTKSVYTEHRHRWLGD